MSTARAIKKNLKEMGIPANAVKIHCSEHIICEISDLGISLQKVEKAIRIEPSYIIAVRYEPEAIYALSTRFKEQVQGFLSAMSGAYTVERAVKEMLPYLNQPKACCDEAMEMALGILMRQRIGKYNDRLTINP